MAVKLIRRLLNVDEYHSMAEAGILLPDEKVELINGELIRMSPIGSKHAYVVDRLNIELITRIGKQAVIRIQQPIKVAQHSEPEPDVLLAKGPIERYKEKIPTNLDVILLIEVSDTTLDYDREIKIPLFAKVGIPVVWIVNLQEEEVEVYEDLQKGAYRIVNTFQKHDTLNIPGFDTQIPVLDIFGE